MAKLTDIACRSKGAGMHCDGDGLYLQVKLGATGLNRSWILRSVCLRIGCNAYAA